MFIFYLCIKANVNLVTILRGSMINTALKT